MRLGLAGSSLAAAAGVPGERSPVHTEDAAVSSACQSVLLQHWHLRQQQRGCCPQLSALAGTPLPAAAALVAAAVAAAAAAVHPAACLILAATSGCLRIPHPVTPAPAAAAAATIRGDSGSQQQQQQ